MRVKCLNLRLLIISLFVIISIQLLAAVNYSAFASVSNTVTLNGFVFSCLENGESYAYNRHSYFVGSLGAPVFCGNHGIPSPIGDNLGDSGTLEMYECNDEEIRKILYYGYQGPNEWSGFKEEQHNGVYDCSSPVEKYKWCGTAVTAMALTMTQQTEYTYEISGLKAFLNYINDMPTPPENFVAYFMGGENGQQKLFTWLNNSKGYLKIEKVVANPEVEHELSLGDGCYEVYSDSSLDQRYKVSTVYSKDDGTTEEIPLYPGKYYVREVEPPKGYAWDFKTHEVEIKENETTVMESYNYLQTVRLLLYKIDYSLKDQVPRNVGSLDGAVYGIYLDEELKFKVAEIETNQYGMGMIDNLLPNKYYIKELKAPKGFTINDEIIEVYANDFGPEDTHLDYYIDCYDYPITISLAKCYEDETGIQKGLEGASLQLLTIDGELVDEWTSEEKPHQIKYLSPGKYVLREVEAPFGYSKSEDVIVEVLETSEVQYFYLENERQNIKISFVKELERDPHGLLQGTFSNTMFGIFDGEDNLLEEIKIDADGLGEFVGMLPEGKYYLKELQTEEGYILSEREYTFEVDYDDSGRNIIDIIINNGEPIVNEYYRCSISINKKDKDTGDKLEGVGFTLYDSDGKEIEEAYTDANGQITFENLPIGEYYVKETKPKEGYFCTGEMYSVPLTMETRDRVMSFTNDKLIVNNESPESGSPGDIIIDSKPPELKPQDPEAYEPEIPKLEIPMTESPEPETPNIAIPEEQLPNLEEPEISVQETPKTEISENELKPEVSPVIKQDIETSPEPDPQVPNVDIPKTGDYKFDIIILQMMLGTFALCIMFCIINNLKKQKNIHKIF